MLTVDMSVSDIDECVDGACDVNALCVNAVPGYVCMCKPGYDGNGHKCFGTSPRVSYNTL